MLRGCFNTNQSFEAPRRDAGRPWPSCSLLNVGGGNINVADAVSVHPTPDMIEHVSVSLSCLPSVAPHSASIAYLQQQ